jgi:hypothetical protein
MARGYAIEFRKHGGEYRLATPDDPLEGGERRLVRFRVTVVEGSTLFNDDLAHRQAVLLFALTVTGRKDVRLDTRHMHPTIRRLRRMIIGAALGVPPDPPTPAA